MSGYNLFNLLTMDVMLPSRKQMADMIRALPVQTHGDLRPWNMILGPRGITLIDDKSNGRNEEWEETLEHCATGVERGITDAMWYHMKRVAPDGPK